MKSRFQGNSIVPILLVLVAIWVLSKPLSDLGLYLYKFTGSYLNSLRGGIAQTQKDATDMLDAQKKLSLLEDENSRLRLANSKLQAQQREVYALREQLGHKRALSFETIPARIIGRSPDTWHKQIILNKGKVDGIKVGKAVMSNKAIIGQVARASLHNSVVQLVFDRNFRIGAKIAGSNLYGVLAGAYPEPAMLEFINVGSSIRVGDEVVASGISLNNKKPSYPENYPIGKVKEINKNPNAVDLLVSVELHEKLPEIREVFVLR